jgi:hypothetical protein
MAQRGHDGRPSREDQESAATCEMDHRCPASPGRIYQKSSHNPEDDMIEMLAFALVAVALAAPGLIHLVWGPVEIAPTGK